MSTPDPPKPPKPLRIEPAPPPEPILDDKDLTELARKRRERDLKRRGRSSLVIDPATNTGGGGTGVSI